MTSPVLARELPDGSRVYDHPRTRETAPSVTTVIAAGIPKPRLTGWSDRLAAEYADANWDELSKLASWERIERIRYSAEREREKASRLGTAVHEATEAWGKGMPHEHSKEVDPFMTSFTRFLMEKRPKFLINEGTVWSEKHLYAGTFDWIAEIGGKVILGDSKTGKGIYPEVGLQVSALAHGDYILHPDGRQEELPAIDGLAVLHVRPRSWKLVEITHSEENFSAFLACRELYNWSTEVSPKVLGAAA
jgi:hypothetical protein